MDRHERLRRRAEFLEIYARGEKFRGRFLFLYILTRPGRDYSRLGVTASRKVGGPVVRNRAKRRIKEIFRAHKEAAPGCDIVVNVGRGAVEASFRQIEEEYVGLIRQWSRKHGLDEEGD